MLYFSLSSFLVNREGENTPFVLWLSSGLSDPDADGALVAGKGGPRRLWLEWQLDNCSSCTLPSKILDKEAALSRYYNSQHREKIEKYHLAVMVKFSS